MKSSTLKPNLILALLAMLDPVISFDTRYRADDLTTKSCSNVTISTDCTGFVDYYSWNSTTGRPIQIKTASDGNFYDCYVLDYCYLFQMIPPEQDCEYEVIIDGTTTQKGTIRYEQPSNWFLQYIPDTIIRVGNCSVKGGIELFIFTYNDRVDDFHYTFERFGEIDESKEGLIPAGNYDVFNLNSSECNFFEASQYSYQGVLSYFIVKNGFTIEHGPFSSEGISYGCPRLNCSDQSILIQNIESDPIVYNLTENDIFISSGNISAGASTEICIDSSKCNILTSNGHAKYIIFLDDNNHEIDYSSYYYSEKFKSYRYKIGTCERKCDLLPVLSTTQRGKHIMSQLATISGMDVLVDPTTSQYKSACWIIFDDERHLDASSPNLVQRYVLALLYYATTNDTGWTDHFSFLSGKNECDWNGSSDVFVGGVFCDDEILVSELYLRE